MKNSIWILGLFLLSLNLSAQEVPTEMKTEFDATSLGQALQDLEGNKTTVGEVLGKYKGKTVFLDLWASWCPDCIKGLPKLKEVQAQYPDVVYLFLSLDRVGKEDAWKTAIDKYEIKGEHYWFNAEWKNAFTIYIGINWIPRYMLIDKEGKIAHYYAIHADDPQMMETLVELKLNPETE
ncbi:TlpA family protein disulfide reductase [Moheibacter sediminis]|uniref:Thiol-disulfide isomerase or thioredoxin n=1 Tax=Moheibacter sediminis TaxID=1434700 RepID=A0A1W1Y8Z6_9FLAO|nr:TlpA disulfide reductase family protein [Moheibacter sediminis]SMC32301.1 Thiol-disulfide isomerase or thioredoxin [Moheibacter sediminis]